MPERLPAQPRTVDAEHWQHIKRACAARVACRLAHADGEQLAASTNSKESQTHRGSTSST